MNQIASLLRARPVTIVDVLRERAETQTERDAFVFLRYRSTGQPEADRLTYGELLGRAQAVAAVLQQRCARGDRALILAPPGLNYIAAFLGCQIAGVVAVPAYPPRNAKHKDRLTAIARDCGAAAVLAVTDLVTKLAEWSAGRLPEAIAIDALPEGAASAWRDVNVRPEDLAFLQYTSGTTGAPKGVMVGHDNLVANWEGGARGRSNAEDVLVGWLPPYHDLGLIGCILQPLFGGFLHVSMTPVAFLQEPSRWLRAMSDWRATVTMAPNFAYELCCGVGEDAVRGLDLSSLRYAVCGGEPARADTLERFARCFTPVGFDQQCFAPGYGLAESTLQLALSLPGKPPTLLAVHAVASNGDGLRGPTSHAVSNGAAIERHDLRIVDPETCRVLPAGAVGEVWAAGPTIARGYWGRPELSEATFDARLAENRTAGPFLRTGDLGALVNDELYVLGRLKELIIVRGRNHYPRDIEATVATSHPTLAFDSTIAFGWERNEEERLVVVQELKRSVHRDLNAPMLFAAIRRAVVEAHEVDPYAIVLVHPASLPRTTSGKLQRLMTREMFSKKQLATVVSWSADEALAEPAAEVGGLVAKINAAPAAQRRELLRRHLAERVRTALGLAELPGELTGFADLGLDSLKAVQLGNLINVEMQLDPPLPATVLFDQPNLAALAQTIEERLGLVEAARPAGVVRSAGWPAAEASIAVVGVAARVPGGADAAGFWRLLAEGRDAVVEVPRDRFDVDVWYDPDPDAAGKIYTRRAGFLDRVDLFDAGFFGISPREAASMDPQQRLVLETAWTALEDAGIAPERLRGSRTGVYVGVAPSEYGQTMGAGGAVSPDTYFATGMAPSVIAGRVAFVLGLEGPTLAIDTACSSSLVAVHQACQALRASECDAALAGGVNLILGVQGMLATCRARMLSADGRCKTFDASADGYGRGEGVGVVVLKRLADAERDGDRIVAVIRGSAVNQDGASGGLTVPNGAAQERLMAQALAQAGVAPSDVAYLEAHGTGTLLGDPIEVGAAARALGVDRPADRPLLLGSVKANIGHLEAAAGIAGLIKVVLALQAGELPGQAYFREPNPHILWSELPVAVVRERRAWPAGRRIAGVSSFGFSGTNAHVVMEGYAATQTPALPSAPVLAERGAQVLALSAKSEAALTELAGRYGAWLACVPEAALGDVCFTAGTGRNHFAHRAAVVAATREELGAGLSALASGVSHAVVRRGSGRGTARVGVLFTGQGSQWAGMGGGLYLAEPVFREVVDRCAAAVDGLGLHAQPLLSVLLAATGSPEASLLDHTAYAQPALYALQCGLWSLWRGWGLEAAAVLGHSVGEYAAAYAAGVFSLEDGARLVGRRGALMGALPAGGAMAAVFAPAATVAASLVRANAQAEGAGLSLAAENGTHRVISGPAAQVEAVLAQWQASGVRCQRLAVSHAFHSALLDPMLEELEAAAAAVEHRPPELTLVSNLTGAVFASGIGPDAAYWRRHARECVRYAESVASLAGMSVELLLELGPRAVLGPLALGCWPAGSAMPTMLASLRPDAADERTVAEALAGLYAAGASVNFAAREAGRNRRRLALPSYPFERVRHWVEMPKRRLPAAMAMHPLLGMEHRSASGEVTWTQELSATEPGWVGDHVVFGSVMAPGALYACMATATGSLPVVVQDGQIDAALVLQNEQPQEVQLLVAPVDDVGARVFRVFARAASAAADAPWRLHASGKIAPASAPAAVEPSLSEPLAERDVEAFYAAMAALGLGYGPSFRGVVRLWGGAGVARGEIAASEGVAGVGAALHPAMLDACFQVVAAALRADAEVQALYVPLGWQSLELWGATPVRVVCEARLREEPRPETVVADLWLRDAAGVAFGRMSGLVLKQAKRQAMLGAAQGVDELLYEVAWREVATAGTAETPSGPWLVLGDAERAATLCSTLAAHGVAALMSATGRDVASLLADVLSEAAAQRTPLAGVAWLAEPAAGQNLEGATGEAALAPVLALAQALIGSGVTLSRGLTLVTAGAMATAPGEDAAPLEAALWGFGRVLQAEEPGLAVRLVDVAVDEAEALATMLLAGGEERQLAYREGTWLAPRLLPQRRAGRLTLPAGEARLAAGTAGTLEALQLVAAEVPPPGAGEVQVAVLAAGLNFRDVLSTLGLYPGDAGPLGGECVGVVTAVGKGVAHLALGDAVFGFAPGSFATRCISSAALLRRLPAGLNAAAAATLPVAGCTAMAAFDLAELSAGDRVLIHAGAGGVGLAAIQLAQAAGAEVFATASAGKQAFLRVLGVGHVHNSRSLSFAAEILAATEGRGVDVVLNSLTGDGFIAASLSALVPGGRFVEIGKRGVWTPGEIAAARPDVAYHILALDDWTRDEPAGVGALLDRVVAGLVSGRVTPLPRRCFALAEAPAAMRLMQRAGHIGKLVLTVDQPQPRADGTYLVTGGLGALGLAAAAWLAEAEAGRVVLVGRRAPDAAATAALAEIASRTGCTVETRQADIADAGSVRRLVTELAVGPQRLRGVIHAAGVLDDGVVAAQSWTRFAAVLAPKLAGALHLHRAIERLSLDFFVLYSSVAATLGNAGQASYAAANAALEALAQHRRSLGLPATSVAWGPWDVGMAASERARAQVASEGLRPLTVGPAHAALTMLLRSGAADGVVLDADWTRLGRQLGAARPPLLSQLIRAAAPAAAGALRARLAATPAALRRAVLLGWLGEAVQGVLRLPAVPGPMAGFGELGMDSLPAMELRNRLNAELQLDPLLPASVLFDHPNLAALAETIEAQMGVGASDTAVEEAPRAILECTAPLPHANHDAELISDDLLLPRLWVPHLRAHRSAERPRQILLTGATGFLGGYLAAELLARSDADVICLVRAANDDEAEQRLHRSLAVGGRGLAVGEVGNRLRAVAGELDASDLGLGEERLHELAAHVDLILHNGAHLNLAVPYSALRGTNVGGTRSILRLAALGGGIPVHYVSSLGVFLTKEYYQVSTVMEKELPEREYGFLNGYVQTKWVAERNCRMAQARGLPVTIYRPGFITGDTSSGYWPFGDVVTQSLRLGAMLGVVAEFGFPWVPVDYVASAVTATACSGGSSSIPLHLIAPRQVSAVEIANAMRSVDVNVTPMIYVDWCLRAESFLQDRSDGAMALGSLLFQNDSDQPIRPVDMFASTPTFDTTNTRHLLSQFGVECQDLTPEVLERYLRFLAEHGAFKSLSN